MMRRLLYFLHISPLLQRTTVCSFAILDSFVFSCEYFIIFAKYRQAVAFVYIDRYKKDFDQTVKVLCLCILLSIIDFKPLRLPIRFQKWSPSGCSIPTV